MQVSRRACNHRHSGRADFKCTDQEKYFLVITHDIQAGRRTVQDTIGIFQQLASLITSDVVDVVAASTAWIFTWSGRSVDTYS